MVIKPNKYIFTKYKISHILYGIKVQIINSSFYIDN